MEVSGSLSRSNAEIAVAAILVAAAAGLFWTASGYPRESAVYPQVLAGLLAAFGLAMAARELVRRLHGRPAGGRFVVHAGRLVIALAAVLVYVGAIAAIGFLIPSLVFGTALPLAAGYRRLWVSATTTVIALAFILLVFVVLLERPLPPDVLSGLIEAVR